MKSLNRALVFETIRKHGFVSRSQLVELTKLTPSTITNIAGEFLGAGLIHEMGLEKSSGGRRRILLQVNGGFRYVVGAYLARSEISCGVFGLDGRIVTLKRGTTGLLHGTNVTVAELVNLVRETIGESGVDRKKIAGIGIGAPGPLNADQGWVECPPNFPGWTGVPINDIISKEFDVPTFLGNDVNISALAERLFGQAQNEDDFAYFCIEEGVGAGIYSGGQLCQGIGKLTGGFGHISVDYEGARCACGNRGCLEPLVNISGILARARRGMAEHPESLLWEVVGGNAGLLTTDMVGEAARRGDTVAGEVVRFIGRTFGIAMVTVINLFHPRLLLLGYGISKSWSDLLVPLVWDTLRQHAMEPALRDLRLEVSKLEEPVVLGAAATVIQRLTQHVDRFLAVPGD